MHTWHLTALEFRTLWEATGRDVLPYPLHHRHTTDFRADTDRLRRKAAESLQAQFDTKLDYAVAALLAPYARVEVAGTTGGVRTIRAHGGTRDKYAALAIQAPGDEANAGDITLHLMSPGALAAAVLATLPTVAPGKGREIKVTAAELASPRPHVRDPWNPTPREQLETFLAKPTDTLTHIGVYAHASVDNRHTEGRDDFQLHDLTNDGRYVFYGETTFIAKPTTPTRLRTTLTDMLTATATKAKNGTYRAP
ncbi:ESX secretion-associated protein EspG [Nocardia asteroides]|uniref:ESX secretion-associated protein EspG n=1 Tax=Nocardia asteroides TaxID=1824 RepID=UPI001E40666C|nr:ESX secretion-associated protein EspG [Nocardia asteroides]UGT58286.1 ESX secretion-associated protein EspG [Nocardia asteroides]